VDRQFPIHLWDRLIPQAELTLNLLRGSRINPKLSAWAQLHGLYDFNHTPIAPPGMRVLVHEKPSIRQTWALHAVDGWYLGPALDSYRCYTVWIRDTRAQRICDTLTWIPDQITMPTASSADYIIAGIHDIAQALRKPSANSPLAPLADNHVAALRDLMDLLHGSTKDTQPDAPPLRVGPSTPLPLPRQREPPLRVALPATSPTPDPNCTATTGAVRNDETTSNQHNTRAPTPAPPATEPRSTQPTQRQTRSMTRPRRSVRHIAAAARVPQQQLQHTALHGNAFNPDTGKLAEYGELSRSSDGHLWQASNIDEIHCLAQGHGNIEGTNTMFFIPVSAIPRNKKATYLRIVCAHRPEKTVPHRVRWTVGGDRVEYDGDVSTKTADLITAKLLFNSVLSTPNGRCMMGDLKDFYLGTPMPPQDYAYMRIPLAALPQSIMEHYHLHDLVHNGHVYVEIRRGMYGLPQAGKIANAQLQAFLAPHGYHPCPITPGLWTHDT